MTAERAVHAFVMSCHFVWFLEGMLREFALSILTDFTTSYLVAVLSSAPLDHHTLHAQEPLQTSLQALNLGCINTDDPPACFGCLGQLQLTSVWQP